jgi:predicted AlkP superfamily pyrophosphatase or phosphodiesterase
VLIRRVLTAGLLLCITFLFLLIPGCESPTPKYVLLIGWDGAQRNHVNECLTRNELPNLQALIDQGSKVGISITGTTDTKAGWTQILTGYFPEVTNVYSNSKYQAIPAGLSIFERLEKYYGDENVFTAAVIGKKDHVDNAGPQKIAYKPGDNLQGGTVVTEAGKQFLQIPAKPYYYTSQNMDSWENGLVQNNVVGQHAVDLLSRHKGERGFYFIHFAEVDTNGHASGENSKEYNNALISCDNWLGKIVGTLKDLDMFDQALIYVTADHGFDEGLKTHSNAPYVFLATNDVHKLHSGWRQDITPTIMDRLGLPLSQLEPILGGKSLYD